MKKLVACFLIVALCLCAAACGSEEKKASSQKQTTASNSTQTQSPSSTKQLPVRRNTTLIANYLHTIAVRNDGTVLATGSGEGLNVSDWTNIISVASDRDHTIGLRDDGTVVATGFNSEGACEVSGWTDIVFITTSDTMTAGVRADGTVVVAGNCENLEEVNSWNDIVSVEFGLETDTLIGLRADGTVVGLEYNDTYNPEDWHDIVELSVENRCYGLRADGTVAGPRDYQGKPTTANWKNVSDIEWDEVTMVFLNQDGTLTFVKEPLFDISAAKEWTDLVAVSAGMAHMVGLKSDGTVVVLGYDLYGRCDVSDWTDIRLP